PPFIPLPSINNLRDIGGLPISSSSTTPLTVRRGLVYRAANTTTLDAAGVAKLQSLGLGVIFDLRAVPEIERTGGVEELERLLAATGGVVERRWTPVFEEQDYGPETIALRFKNYAFNGTEGFAIAYAAILKNGAPSFHRILTHFARPDARAILVHCSAGKDRTGVFSAVLLSALGVSDDDVADEYALTEVGLAEAKPTFIARLMEHEVFQVPNGREGAENMTTSRYENMLATLDLLRREYGSAEKYLLDFVKLPRADLEAIRRKMI
ncbi:hypothetical protein P152DRAFT_369524, partial [Eremomyces bilateralis CBS 781.70]